MVRLARLIVCAAVLAPLVASAATPQAPKRILLLREAAGGLPPMRETFAAAFIEAVRSATPAPIAVYEETFESMRIAAARQFRLARRSLTSKYAGDKIDVIVAIGASSLALARQSRRALGAPAIVALVAPTGRLDAADNVTGLQGGFAAGGTLDLALVLRPDTRTALVVDGTSGDSVDQQFVLERLLQDRRIGVTHLRNLSLSDVMSRVAAAPPHSVVLFLKQDLGTERLSPFDAIQAIADVSHVPVFSHVEAYVGHGSAGGYVWDVETDARRVAEMAVRLSAGVHIRDVPSGRLTYKTVLDWRQLERWGIPAPRVPAGAIVRYRPLSFVERYRAYVVGGTVIFAGQLALTIGLLVQRVRRRRAEADSRRNEERYRSVVDTQSELICRYLPDTTLTFVNDAYCRFANKPRRALLGRKFIELIPESARQAVLERVRNLRSGIDSHEHEVLLPDATVGWQHWINHGILDDRGKLIELQGVGRDITDRKRAEAALSQSEARNSAMLRAIPDLMFMLTRDGRYVDYHARDPALLYAPPGAFMGRTVREVMPAPLAGTLMEAIDRACRSHEPIVVEYDLPLDETRFFEARLVRVDDDRVLSMVRDVTEAKRAMQLNRDLAERLIGSQEAERQRIARELHDDLSQKIALVNIEVDQIAQRTPAGEARSRMRQLAGHVGEIATAVHNLSHELHPSRLEMLGLVASVRSLCHDLSRQSGVQVVFTHDDLPSGIDPNVSLCLYRIVQEALHNVARHSQATEANVRLRHQAGALALQIADTGVGFDPRDSAGGGLGLVSMRERVASVRGELAIGAERGRGTCIDVRVPIAA